MGEESGKPSLSCQQTKKGQERLWKGGKAAGGGGGDAGALAAVGAPRSGGTKNVARRRESRG